VYHYKRGINQITDSGWGAGGLNFRSQPGNRRRLRHLYREAAGEGSAHKEQADVHRFHWYALDDKPIDAKMLL
jgi:hypothetical protein